jgi:hypothetical protein
MQYLHYDLKSTLSRWKENAIPTQQFKHIHNMWVEICNTYIMTLNSHYLSERKMQYLHDNLNMHIICGW